MKSGYDRPRVKLKELISPEFRYLLTMDPIDGQVSKKSLAEALVKFSREDQDELEPWMLEVCRG